MKIDLLHNKIVEQTMTDAFKASVDSRLLPLLYEIYPEDELLGVQMYEDYIADRFESEGFWYYPLTVITRSGYDTVWIKWELTEGDFEGNIPYAFVGEGEIEFAFAKDTPNEFAHALEGRSLYCEDGLIRVGVNSTVPPARLSGKYSQTFLDELARQITPAIECATSTMGVADSSIELVFTFASGTYMDHISDNVTYRRLTMIDGASAPRDFWVKWTRLDASTAYSVADHVWGDNILFEVGEDVSGKVLEREFRYLFTSDGDKYHSAMSRSGVTAWRDLIKRGIKYGDIVKIEKEIELLPETLALNEQLAAVLGVSGPKAPEQEIEETVETDFDGDDEFSRAMRKAREIAFGGSTSEPERQEESEIEEYEEEAEAEEYTEAEEEIYEVTEDEGEEICELPEDEAEESDIDDLASEEDEIEEILDDLFGAMPEEELESEPEAESDLDELTRMALEALAFAKDADDEPDDEPISEMVFEIVEPEAEEDESEIVEDELEIPEDEPEVEEESPVEEEAVEEIAPEAIVLDEDRIREEIEAKIRLEYENRARLRAEEELSQLRREQERLRIENEAMLAKAEREKEAIRREYEKLKEQTMRDAVAQQARDAVRRAEEERLRAEIETRLRQEARERERLAEAARMAIEEQRRLEAEAARAQRVLEEEARERAEAARMAAEAARLEEMRRAELERVRREEETRQKVLRETMPEMGNGQYNYTTRTVRLIFRRSVDPNITARIQEIMKAAVEYYGKEKMYIKVRASVPDNQTVLLEFIHIPLEEMELLGNIIKILGNSGLGIARAIIE